MVSLYRFLLASVVVYIGVEAKAVNKGRYDEFVFNNLPQFLQEMRELDWEKAKGTDTYHTVDDEEDAYYPYDDVIPGKLRDVPGWPLATTPIGQVGGVAVDKDDNLVVFHRGRRVWDGSSFISKNVFNPGLDPIQSDVITTFDPASGQAISSFGAGMFLMPHGLTIDQENNLWVTDVGLHQVMKFPKGSDNATLVLGVEREPGSDDTHFCKPTDVAVASNGNFFVADGYCNSRILKFAKDGSLLGQFGHTPTGSNLGPDMFRIPHSLALDEKRDRLCVADRENRRIQCFSAGLQNGHSFGAFQRSYEPRRGAIYAIEYEPYADVMYVVNGGNAHSIEGFTLDLEGNILESWTPENQRFGLPHDVTVSQSGSDVYVGDIGDTGRHPKVWRFIRTA